MRLLENSERRNVNEEILCFAFEAISKKTICEGMKLQIEYKPIQAKCKNCEQIFEFDVSVLTCPQCKGNFEILPDEPLILETIDFQEKEA